METQVMSVNLMDLLVPVSGVVDMMSPALAEHHMRAAYITWRLCEELRMPGEEMCDAVLAASLHDIGAFSLQERMDILEFEETKPMEHSKAGYLLLKSFGPFAHVSEIVRYHHTPWNDGRGASLDGEPVPRAAHILHLADRIAVLMPSRDILRQSHRIGETIEAGRGSKFVPEQVDAFHRIARRDVVWLEAGTSSGRAVGKNLRSYAPDLDTAHMVDFAKLLCRIIDFKSEFTATHTSGIVAVAVELARRIDFPERDCRMIEIAAYLHDLGKLAIPVEIIEKGGKLTDDEWDVMRSHVYYTYKVLESIEALGPIIWWSALHQERLDGTGYPFGYSGDMLSTGSRIVAVADIFTALTEDRPYRKGMSKAQVHGVLADLVEQKQIDANLVALVLASFEAFNTLRASAQEQAIREYHEFRTAMN